MEGFPIGMILAGGCWSHAEFTFSEMNLILNEFPYLEPTQSATIQAKWPLAVQKTTNILGRITNILGVNRLIPGASGSILGT